MMMKKDEVIEKLPNTSRSPLFLTITSKKLMKQCSEACQY